MPNHTCSFSVSLAQWLYRNSLSMLCMSLHLQSKAFVVAALEQQTNARYLKVTVMDLSLGTPCFVLLVSRDWAAGADEFAKTDTAYLASSREPTTHRRFRTLDAAYREVQRMADEARACAIIRMQYAAEGWYSRDGWELTPEEIATVGTHATTAPAPGSQ